MYNISSYISFFPSLAIWCLVCFIPTLITFHIHYLNYRDRLHLYYNKLRLTIVSVFALCLLVGFLVGKLKISTQQYNIYFYLLQIRILPRYRIFINFSCCLLFCIWCKIGSEVESNQDQLMDSWHGNHYINTRMFIIVFPEFKKQKSIRQYY